MIKLFPQQREALRRVLKEPFYPLFMEQGTGKTLVAIKAIEERFKRGLGNRALIFVPNYILDNWEMELEKFLELPKDQYVIETLSQKKAKRVEAFEDLINNDPELLTLKQLKALGYTGKKKDIIKNHKPKLLIIVTNYEKASVEEKMLGKFKPHTLVLDESHNVKGRTSERSKSIYRLSRQCSSRILMTGTPIVQGYEDLFMQYKIMRPEIFGGSYKDFEDRYIIKGGYMNYDIIGYNNVDELKQIIKETSYRVLLKDCAKLPPLSTKYYVCDLNAKAQKIYRDMEKDMLVTLEELAQQYSRNQLKATCRARGIDYKPKDSYLSLLMKVSPYLNTASCEMVITQAIRLQQISGGFLTLDTGEVVNVSKDKANIVKDIVLDSSRPLIIFCQYVAEIELLYTELSRLKRDGKKLRVANFRGKGTRKKVYQDFQAEKLDVLILQLQSGSVGLNLQVASRLIFYSWNYSSGDYVQAISRMKRTGQKNKMEVIHIIANHTRDREILEIVKGKRKLADMLLD